MSKADRGLMIKLDQDDGAVNPVIVDGVVFGPTDPGEVGVVEMGAPARTSHITQSRGGCLLIPHILSDHGPTVKPQWVASASTPA